MGSKAFNKIQYGEETVAKGTAAACTNLWVGQMPPVVTDTKPTYPEEDYGIRMASFRSVSHQKLYLNTLSTEHGAFQHIPLLGGAGLKGGVTPAEQTGGQGDYLWNFSPSMTSIDDIDSFSLRFGDNVQAWLANYTVVERIRISGQVAQGNDASPVKLEADIFARQIATTTFTSNINEPTLVPLSAKLARLYVDTSWAGIGGTEAANLLRSFDIEIITGQKPKFAGSADETFGSHGGGTIGIMGTFGLEGGSVANGYLENQRAGDFVAVRLDINGPQIGSGDNYLLRVDFGGSFEDARPIDGDDRGDNLANFVVHGYYNKTENKGFEFSCITNSNAY